MAVIARRTPAKAGVDEAICRTCLQSILLLTNRQLSNLSNFSVRLFGARRGSLLRRLAKAGLLATTVFVWVWRRHGGALRRFPASAVHILLEKKGYGNLTDIDGASLARREIKRYL